MSTYQIKSLLAFARQQLSQTSDTAGLDAELLLAKTLNLTRAQLLTQDKNEVTAEAYTQYLNLVQRRRSGEPIAYILGYREFWSLSLEIGPGVLIPRPETELLVEIALKQLTDANLRIADLGTGSGAIALALAYEHPDWQVVATDVSPEALKIAETNAKRLNLTNIEFRKGNWFNALQPQEKFHAIISNPPYIAEKDPHLAQGDLQYEPQQALISGEFGLDAIHHIIQHAPSFLLPGGWLLLEHGFDQAESVLDFFHKYGFIAVKSYSDLAGLPRVAAGQF